MLSCDGGKSSRVGGMLSCAGANAFAGGVRIWVSGSFFLRIVIWYLYYIRWFETSGVGRARDGSKPVGLMARGVMMVAFFFENFQLGFGDLTT